MASDRQSMTIECTNCGGSGKRWYHGSHIHGGPSYIGECPKCKGTGKQQSAADFTEQREQQIRDVVEEIALVRDSYKTCFNIGKANEFKDETRRRMNDECLIWQRILATLERQLAELKKGFKE